ncbi:MAG TPA: hypothetical protein VKG01_16645 [Thermoanaerobaculia bacterium]|nr:hypothetical protein [Thermoanaerobaculia bacterium]
MTNATGNGPGSLLRLDSGGAVLETLTVGIVPRSRVFDGSNIWVPNSGSSSVSIVRAATGVLLSDADRQRVYSSEVRSGA